MIEQAAMAGTTIVTGYLAKRVFEPFVRDRLAAAAQLRRAARANIALIPAVLAAVRDVGDRVAMVEGRSWSHCQLDPDKLIFEADASGGWTRINRAMVMKTGRTQDELLGAEWLNMVDPADRQRVRAEWHAAVADGREFEQRCLVSTKKYVRRIPMTFHAIPNRRPCTGAVIGYTGHLLLDDEAPA